MWRYHHPPDYDDSDDGECDCDDDSDDADPAAVDRDGHAADHGEEADFNFDGDDDVGGGGVCDASRSRK